MKFGGRAVAEVSHVRVVLPRAHGGGLELLLRPLSLGFQRGLRMHGIVPPLPPCRVARDAHGVPIRNPNGEMAVVRDDTDADYRRSLELYHHRVAVLALAEGLRDDANVQFETILEPGAKDWTRAADDLLDELDRAGWSLGDLTWVCNRLCQLSNLVESQVNESLANFPQATAKTS